MKGISSIIQEKNELIILTLIIITGGALRLWALNFGLPNPVCRPDELEITYVAWHFWGDPNPHFFNYPTLFMCLLFFCYLVYFGFGFIFGAFNSLAQFHDYIIKEFNPFNDKINDSSPIYDQIDAFYVPYSNYAGVNLPGPLIRIYKRKFLRL